MTRILQKEIKGCEGCPCRWYNNTFEEYECTLTKEMIFDIEIKKGFHKDCPLPELVKK